MSFLKSMALPPFGFQRILRQTITRMMIPIAIARTELMTRILSHFEFRGKFLRQSCYFTMMFERKIRAPRQRATAHGAEKLDRLNLSPFQHVTILTACGRVTITARPQCHSISTATLITVRWLCTISLPPGPIWRHIAVRRPAIKISSSFPVFPPAIASKDDWEWNQFLSILHLSRWFETTCLVAVVAYWGDKIILQKKTG